MKLILYGAGAAGRYTLAHQRENVLAFADNDAAKWGDRVDGMLVVSPAAARMAFPDATWVATCISAPAREIREDIRKMGVHTAPLYQVLPCHHNLPRAGILSEMVDMAADEKSVEFLVDQWRFRANPDYDEQIPAEDCADIYFPSFITHREDEHFVDCGAADGDTIQSFTRHWERWSAITAFEPDDRNREKIHTSGIAVFSDAISDHDGVERFVSSGDYSSHLGDGMDSVTCFKLDHLLLEPPPTYVKMDIEGAEMAALWGARQVIADHSPVLAICAYHKSEDLWQIPLLIHALNPDYKLFFRRYAEGAWEIVWYAVPPSRIAPRVPLTHESYSENHSG